MGNELLGQTERRNDDEIIKEPVEGFVENDYRVDDDQSRSNEEAIKVDFYFCFGVGL